MSKATLVAFGVSITTLLSGCVIVADVDSDWSWGEGWVEREERFAAVNRVEFDARGTLYIIQGDENAMQLEGHGTALKQLHVNERNGTVIITQSRDDFRWFEVRGGSKEPIYTLEISALDELVHRGHGTVKVGPFTSEKLEVVSTGHAKTLLSSVNGRAVQIKVRDQANLQVETLDADRVEIQVHDHGSAFIQDAHVLHSDILSQDHGQLSMSGKADTLRANVGDHSDVDAAEFVSAQATLHATGHARATFNVTSAVDLEERDHSNIALRGSAKVAAVAE
jgi:hypothetical protein